MRYVSLFKKNNEPPWDCYFCGEVVEKLLVHHVDHDHDNNSLENLVPAHKKCHDQYHQRGREITWGGKISKTKKRQWAEGVYDGVRMGVEHHTEETKRKISESKKGKGLKSHCVHGHEYTPENTYVTPKGWKQCRQCKADRRLASRAV